MNEVVNGIARREDVELAFVPRGTGMDFGRTYGIPAKAEQALDVAAGGIARTVDLGRARYRSWAGEEEERWFGNVASAGMSGAVARRANSTSKALGGKASFFIALVAVFARWRNVAVRVRLEDAEREGLVSNVIVANGQYQGGKMWIAPEARPDDGLFDVLVIGDITKPDFVRNVGRIYRGTHLTHPKIELLRSPWVEVDADERLPIELDGEQPGTTPVRFDVVPGALRVRVPA
jgi:diacylglycerol kinase (ATP)